MQTDPKARTCAIGLFAELPGVVKKKEKYLIQEQVTQSLVPLLLHLQDEEPEVVKVRAARGWQVQAEVCRDAGRAQSRLSA